MFPKCKLSYKRATEDTNRCFVQACDFLLLSNSLRSNENSLISRTGWVKENESFLLVEACSRVVEPCSRVIYCVEIKLQFCFRKYISICTVYTVLIRLISAFLYDLRWTHGGSNSWEKRTASGTKMEQWSVFKSCRQHGLFVLRLTFWVKCLRMPSHKMGML